MALKNEQYLILERFAGMSNLRKGSVILDLDGTALYEDRGKVFISGSVEKGVRAVTKLGIPVIINTLRFPLSVVSKIADEWLEISSPVIPAILLNGSQSGTIRSLNGEIVFEETAAFPMSREEILEITAGLAELVANNIVDFDFFYYPRDWKKGEIIWVPDQRRIQSVKEKYLSAKQVYSSEVRDLENSLLKDQICMISLFIDKPKDTLMAYQHKEPNSFFTTSGVNKTFGAKTIAAKMNISLDDSLAAGDNIMDNFLSSAGLAVIVGKDNLPYRGRKETIWAENPAELGDLLGSLCNLLYPSQK